jgi:hypothetical protein
MNKDYIFKHNSCNVRIIINASCEETARAVLAMILQDDIPPYKNASFKRADSYRLQPVEENATEKM